MVTSPPCKYFENLKSDPVNKGIQSNLVIHPFCKNVAEYNTDSLNLRLASNDLQLDLP